MGALRSPTKALKNAFYIVRLGVCCTDRLAPLPPRSAAESRCSPAAGIPSAAAACWPRSPPRARPRRAPSADGRGSASASCRPTSWPRRWWRSCPCGASMAAASRPRAGGSLTTRTAARTWCRSGCARRTIRQKNLLVPPCALTLRFRPPAVRQGGGGPCEERGWIDRDVILTASPPPPAKPRTNDQNQTCEYAPVRCPSGGAACPPIPRIDLDDHLQVPFSSSFPVRFGGSPPVLPAPLLCLGLPAPMRQAFRG